MSSDAKKKIRQLHGLNKNLFDCIKGLADIDIVSADDGQSRQACEWKLAFVAANIKDILSISDNILTELDKEVSK